MNKTKSKGKSIIKQIEYNESLIKEVSLNISKGSRTGGIYKKFSQHASVVFLQKIWVILAL